MRRFVRCCLLPRPTPANECVGQGMRKYEKGRPGLGIPPPDGRACFPPWVDSDLLCSKNHWTTSSKNLSRSSSTFKFLDFLYQELHFEMDLTLSTSSSLSYITPSDQRGIFTGVVMMWETKTKEKIKLAYRLQPIGRKKEIKIRYHGNQISTPNTGLTHVTEINSRILFLLCQPDKNSAL
ncbi:uncharacterized protein LOC125753068 isoform X3 [Canis lupus dingo]|uniref:uncharacterized protein LOC125753068 isoform X3 n=1 Tax=Canis lupus dingo TaxID=286419 RepID=UPI0020C4EE2C|nr:uncharacterized protein LOC125753068 isoform X3 [Canis lupus dingo]